LIVKVVGLTLRGDTVPAAQAIDVNPEGHVPLNTWTLAPAARREAPIEDNVIVGLVLCATKEYHTSAPAVPPHVPEVTFGEDCVFSSNVCPARLEQLLAPTELRAVGALQTLLCAFE
jgi:hypothetical protein